MQQLLKIEMHTDNISPTYPWIRIAIDAPMNPLHCKCKKKENHCILDNEIIFFNKKVAQPFVLNK